MKDARGQPLFVHPCFAETPSNASATYEYQPIFRNCNPAGRKRQRVDLTLMQGPFILHIPLHCNIQSKHVTSTTTQARTRPHTPLARVVAFVLLLWVTYSATAEVAHKHGELLSATQTSATTISESTDHSTTEDWRSTGECLICQLHQHLYSGLLISLPGFAPPQTQPSLARTTFVSAISQPSAPQRGRAPPIASLV